MFSDLFATCLATLLRLFRSVLGMCWRCVADIVEGMLLEVVWGMSEDMLGMCEACVGGVH